MKKNRSLTPEYILLMIGYWCCNITEINFAGIYLLGKGYTNGQMGIILATGNLLAFLLGSAVSAYADRHREISPIKMAYVLTGLHMLMTVSRLFMPAANLALFITYLLAVTFHVAAYSLALRVYADYGHSGRPINYGATRAAASTAMGLLSLCLGSFVTKMGAEMLTYATLGLSVLQLVAYRALEVRTRELIPATGMARGRDRGRTEASSIGGFIRNNGGYVWMLLGVVLLFMGHNMFLSFAITVMRSVGGDEKAMGIANALVVFLEIPVMLGYSRFAAHKKNGIFMVISFVFFFLKSLFFALANSVYGIYFATLFQMPSFALYSVASVEYANEVIPLSDATKAQSLAFSVAPIGNVLACLLGGFLFDICGSKRTLMITAAVSLVGLAVAVLGMRSIRRKLREERTV